VSEADAIGSVERDRSSVAMGLTGWDRVSLEIVRSWVCLVRAILGLNGLYAVGRMFAYVEWCVDGRRRRRFGLRMDELFGETMSARDKRDACLRFFVRSRTDKMFYVLQDTLSERDIERCFHIENRELLDACLARGKGAYMSLSHVGSQHVALNFLSRMGYQVGGVRDAKESAVRRFVQYKYEMSGHQGIRYFHAEAFPRDLFRWLRDGRLLMSAMDAGRVRDASQKSVDVDFFGERRPMLAGPLELADRCGAPSLHAIVLSKPRFRYELLICGVLVDPEQEGGRMSDERCAEAMQTYASEIEKFLRAKPCHISRY
jgi:lauroyl/myristoyl acyltransferase